MIMKKPKIGIVILNYKSYDLTIHCLNLLNKVIYPNFFVVVVDNFSPNLSFKFLQEYVNGVNLNYDVEVISSDKNGGYSYGNNIGIKNAESKQADYILIMNNDIEFDNDFLNRMVHVINQHENATMIGPGVIENKKSIEVPHRLNRIKAIGFIFEHLFFPLKLINNVIMRKRLDKYTHPINVYSVKGCCFIIKVKDFKKVNYFDENIFLFGEEFILAEKLYKNNMEVLFAPYIKVYHKHSATINSVYDAKKIFKMQIESHKYYLNNYRHDIPRIVQRVMLISEKVKNNIYEPIIYLLKKVL